MPSIDLGDAIHEEMEAWLNDTDKFMPQGWAYDFTPWEAVLGAEIVPGSFYDLPGTTGKKTKDLFLYDLLWSLSFNGYTKEHQKERREELEKSIDETERIMALPEEEQKNYFHDADDVLREMYEELGMEYHEQTEEEKELLRDNMLRNGCITREERLAEMWRLVVYKKD